MAANSPHDAGDGAVAWQTMAVQCTLPVAKVVLLAAVGAALSRRQGPLDASGRLVLSRLIFNCFVPGLSFSVLGPILTPRHLWQWSGVIVNVFVSVAAGLLVGAGVVAAVQPPRALRRQTLAASALGNAGNLPLVIVAALMQESGASRMFVAQGTTPQQALAYVAVGIFAATLTHFSLGSWLLARREEEEEGEEEDESSAAATARDGGGSRSKNGCGGGGSGDGVDGAGEGERLPLVAAGAKQQQQQQQQLPGKLPGTLTVVPPTSSLGGSGGSSSGSWHIAAGLTSTPSADDGGSGGGSSGNGAAAAIELMPSVDGAAHKATAASAPAATTAAAAAAAIVVMCEAAPPLPPLQQQQKPRGWWPHPRLRAAARGALAVALTPPMLACFVSVAVGSTPAARRALFGDGALAIVGDAASMFGACCVPCLLLLLGATLAAPSTSSGSSSSGSSDSDRRPPLRVLLGVIVARLVVLPVVGVAWVVAAVRWRLVVPPRDRMQVLVMLLPWSVSPALNLHTIAVLHGNREGAMAAILSASYLVAAATTPASLWLFLRLLRPGGLLDVGPATAAAAVAEVAP